MEVKEAINAFEKIEKFGLRASRCGQIWPQLDGLTAAKSSCLRAYSERE
ncbi:hypothetical protein Patl1_01898 [Pistacia atlantica]|uniref:Uncharacterized protein n=1 Tax=Pistacia atlantica TaxID=434234 RepID=A0ACC1CDP3_9ROSI|nr:hypothetical protein Patl1_01898 [Pistacia atlantica]